MAGNDAFLERFQNKMGTYSKDGSVGDPGSFRVEGPQNYARRQRGASGSSRRMVTGDEPAVAGTELGASARVTVKEVPSAAVARRRREGRAGRQGANGSGSRERGGYAARGARRQQGQHGVSGGSASGDADGEVHSGSDAWSAHEQPRRGAAAAAAGGAHGRRGNGESQEKSSQATRAGVAPRPARRSGAAAQRGGRPKPNLADLHSVLDDIESPRRQRDAEAAGGGSTRARGGRVGRASPISAGDARFDRGSDVDDARFGDMGPPPDMGEDFSGGVAALVRDADFGLGAGGDGTASDDDEVSAPAGAAVRGGAVRSRREGTRGRERPRQGVPHPAAGARVEGAYGGGHGGGYVAAHSQPPAVAMPSPGYSTVGAPSSYVGPGGVTYVVDAATGAMVPMAPAMGAPVAQQPPTRKPQRPDGGAKRGSGARGGRRGVHAGSPGRGGDIGDGPFRSLAHQQKESHAFAEGEVSRDEINEARVKSEEEKLYFSRHGRSVDYKPKTLSSYRKNAPKGYYELGTLGSDLNTDELVAKRAKQARMKEFARQLNAVNRETLKRAPKVAPPPPTPDRKPKGDSARDRALKFAQKVPKPKVKTQRAASADDAGPRATGGGGGRGPGRREPMTRVDELEAKHDQMRSDVDAIRREYGL